MVDNEHYANQIQIMFRVAETRMLIYLQFRNSKILDGPIKLED